MPALARAGEHEVTLGGRDLELKLERHRLAVALPDRSEHVVADPHQSLIRSSSPSGRRLRDPRFAARRGSASAEVTATRTSFEPGIRRGRERRRDRSCRLRRRAPGARLTHRRGVSDRRPLVLVGAGTDLEHLPPPARLEPGLLRLAGDGAQPLDGRPSSLAVAVVEGQREPLVLDGPASVDRRAERCDGPLELDSARLSSSPWLPTVRTPGTLDQRSSLVPSGR